MSLVEMIIESGEIVKIENGALWVETYQKSTCGKCVAQSGCGQGLLNKIGSRATQIRIRITEYDQAKLTIGQSVKIGVEESAFISGVFYLYWLPLVFMLLGVVFAKYIQLNDGQSALIVLAALLLGVYSSRFLVTLAQKKKPLEPLLVD